MTAQNLFHYHYATFTNAQLPLLEVAVLYFDKLYILDSVGASCVTIGAVRHVCKAQAGLPADAAWSAAQAPNYSDPAAVNALFDHINDKYSVSDTERWGEAAFEFAQVRIALSQAQRQRGEYGPVIINYAVGALKPTFSLGWS